MSRRAPLTVLLLSAWTITTAAEPAPIVVGSKTFTESYLLAEIMARTLESHGFEVTRQFGFGGTLVCYEALRSGEIHVYPEYTGTISQVILHGADPGDLDELRRGLHADSIDVLAPLGFDNSYALAVTAETASRDALRTISDLRSHPDLGFGLSHEFRNRPDGWPGLRRAYGLETRPLGIEHGLAYQALAEGKIDVTDAYTTDGDLERYGLVVLEDDLGFFPDYRAVPLVASTMPEDAKQALRSLGGRIDVGTMRSLNAAVVVEGRSFASVAKDFLDVGGADAASGMVWQRLARNTLTHLKLTGIALLLACVLGIVAAVAVHRSDRLARPLLYFVGLMQTIPSIALLALMIPLLGVGQLPAVVALFLYSLLPIVRNTVTGLRTVDPLLRRVAEAMGLTRRQQMRHVYLPLAMPHILAGIRTAAVISIGTATLAAFIGAGGLGEPIVTGLALNDSGLILQGAVPAAALAILTELGFELLERRLIPPHLAAGRLPA
ncbi:MAG: glycine betaine ABC transporter substrate-binding protein [Gammaproteobacteria bacterium]